MSKKLSRREWTKLSFSGLAGFILPTALMSCKTSSISSLEPSNTYSGNAEDLGVIIGAHTYSFRDMNLDNAITAMNVIGIKHCELFSQHVEPTGFIRTEKPTPEEWRKQKEQLKKWRATVSMKDVSEIREKIEKAGIQILGYSDTFPPTDSDEEFEQVFKIAKYLQTDTINTSATVAVMKRLDILAKKYKMNVAMHNHAHVEDPNQFATPESFARGMEGNSDFIKINLDIGHFTAANYDAVDFMKKNYEKITSIHIKDRKKNQGPNVPLGEGDTPIGTVLRLIRDNKWLIPANIEYEYKGDDTITEVRKCFDYCKTALNMDKF